MCSEKLATYTTSVEEDEAWIATELSTELSTDVATVATGHVGVTGVARTIRVALSSEKMILAKWMELARGIVHAETPAERELWRMTTEVKECR